MSFPALLIIDVQEAIDHPSWGDDRNNPEAESISAGQAGAEFKSEAVPRDGERVIDKHTNSAFIGTNLERELRERGIAEVVITGVITNNSVEATARMAGNLGFKTYWTSDATATFGRRDFAGQWRTAAEVHAMSLANLDGEYAVVVSTGDLRDQFASRYA